LPRVKEPSSALAAPDVVLLKKTLAKGTGFFETALTTLPVIIPFCASAKKGNKKNSISQGNRINQILLYFF
jgi:hypothetical protein